MGNATQRSTDRPLDPVDSSTQDAAWDVFNAALGELVPKKADRDLLTDLVSEIAYQHEMFGLVGAEITGPNHVPFRLVVDEGRVLRPGHRGRGIRIGA